MQKVPYTKLELRTALHALCIDESTEELVDKVNKKFKEKHNIVLENKSELNKQVAENNGITVIDLINSPNYDRLTDEFKFDMLHSMVDILIEEGLNNKEAWALITLGLGLLDI